MKNLVKWLLFAMMAATLVMAGCKGDDGDDFDPRVADSLQAQIDDLETQLAGAATEEQVAALEAQIAALKEQLAAVENGGVAFAPSGELQSSTCSFCHQATGEAHQAIYDKYADETELDVTIDSVTSTPRVTDPATYNVAVLFTVTLDGAPADLDALPQKRYMAVTYDSATSKFYDLLNLGTPVAMGNGQYSVSAEKADYAPELGNAFVYVYAAEGKLATEGMQLYNNVDNQGSAFGDVDTYESTANVAGCERCHGTPYMKHGYRAAAVDGLPDFAACKTCHYDDRNGGHQDWQILANNPARYAEIFFGDIPVTDAEKTKYAYVASVMNDTHMSHAMEFPYPQSMANCIVCHDGKLDMILTDANFTPATCKSCHPVDATGVLSNAPPLQPLMDNASYNHGGVDLYNPNQTCNGCHNSNALPGASFSAMHTGYNDIIYDVDNSNVKYSEGIRVTVNSATVAPGYNSVTFVTMVETDAAYNAATVDLAGAYYGLYGYDTKDLLYSRLSATTAADYVTKVSKNKVYWTQTADTSAYKADIASGAANRAMLVSLPKYLNAAGDQVALDAPGVTFDLQTAKFVVNPKVADVTKCNACHDALATTFHSPDRGGSIEVCKMCHAVTSPGSHLEMQSRSLDSYVHAIHSFQAFDIGDVDFTDPVEAMEYDMHIEHTYPYFTIFACESCHYPGEYNAPGYEASLPGELSASDYPIDGWVRNIAQVPARLVDPATRTCGACHRTQAIKEDNAQAIKALYDHNATNGYGEEAGDFDLLVQRVYGWFGIN